MAMNSLYFATEARFVKRDGKYYSLGGFSKTLWQRYLKHFDLLFVIARVTENPNLQIVEDNIASEERVCFIDLPYYVGPWEYMKNKRKISNVLSSCINKIENGSFIVRLPGQIGGLVISTLKNKHIPYACEIVGNPWDVFNRSSVNHPLRPIIRVISTLKLKRQVFSSSAALYVTKETLQKIYPVKHDSYNVGVSDVILSKDRFVDKSKALITKKQYSIISVGSLEQLYKAPDIALKAIRILSDEGIYCDLVWLGDGKFKPQMVTLSKTLKIDTQAHFLGNVSSSDVIKYLRDADIFILVSRTEGLPRAIVEAMAQGLPCIGTYVGGIPELLSSDVLINKNDPVALASKIKELISNPEFANQQAARNLTEAYNYQESILDSKRDKYLEYVKNNCML